MPGHGRDGGSAIIFFAWVFWAAARPTHGGWPIGSPGLELAPGGKEALFSRRTEGWEFFAPVLQRVLWVLLPMGGKNPGWWERVFSLQRRSSPDSCSHLFLRFRQNSRKKVGDFQAAYLHVSRIMYSAYLRET